MQELIDFFQTKYNYTLTMLSHGSMLLYSSFTAPAKRQERKSMLITQIIQSISKKPLPAHTTDLLLDVMVEDADGEDVDLPLVVVALK